MGGSLRNVAVRLMYDGARYHGWQVQKTMSTVAGTLEGALSRLCGHVVKVHGCGRTDAGVHAERYCANFRTASSIPPDRLPFAVNSLLPPDIAVQEALYAPDDFDANLSCIKKEYTYRICSSRIRNPFYSGRAYFYPFSLDIGSMKLAAGHFVGTHDFAAVRSVGSPTKTTVRTVHWYEIEQKDALTELRVCANGFLYNMARAMAGTLIYVSEGKILPEELPGLLGKKDRRLTGPTVPPDGLYLTRIWYSGEVGEMFS
ncbi:MAG: tRNA pseudouridine(38-40) synthase TruA [Oscillospiraceae bacterium]|nr:tRNA pseudouridine(38-40) synthase TruA [Oscillospiraceae bacterium]